MKQDQRRKLHRLSYRRMILLGFLGALLISSAAMGADIGAKANSFNRPFTSPEGPADKDHCTRRALGRNPHPAMLEACFYVPYLSKDEAYEWRKSFRLRTY